MDRQVETICAKVKQGIDNIKEAYRKHWESKSYEEMREHIVYLRQKNVYMSQEIQVIDEIISRRRKEVEDSLLQEDDKDHLIKF